MTKRNPQNIAASVRQRLLNLARERQEDFQFVLGRYGVERLLHRIDQTAYRERFVVKGAMLFQLWTERPYRPTRDLDFLAHGSHSVAHFENVFREVCDQTVEDDGLIFDSQSVSGSIIKPGQEYEGVRIALQVTLERARIPMQIDIGFGDVITPAAQQVAYPSMLGFSTAVVSAYPKETVIAEKFQAMVLLGMSNTRMKDFFDLWLLATTFEFYGEVLARAIQATFERRRTPLPETIPIALTSEFHSADYKQKLWKAFVAKGQLATPTLPDVAAQLQTFLMPILNAIRAGVAFRQQWQPAKNWH